MKIRRNSILIGGFIILFKCGKQQPLATTKKVQLINFDETTVMV